jgi:hypothetical protein
MFELSIILWKQDNFKINYFAGKKMLLSDSERFGISSPYRIPWLPDGSQGGRHHDKTHNQAGSQVQACSYRFQAL